VSFWWGIGLIGFTTGNLLLLISPVTITILILFISGIPLLEKKYQDSKDWQEYVAKTPPLIPKYFNPIFLLKNYAKN
jgi:steroid 5-alpha reductase family enzyme